MAALHHLPFLVSISRNRCHWSSTATVFLPLTARLSSPYSPMKDAMRAPPLSSAPTPAPISPPCTRNHLPIEAPPTASVERHRVAISTASPPSDVIGKNPNDLHSLSLSELSRWPPEPRIGRTAPWSWVHHGSRDSRGPVIHRLIHDFFYPKTFLRNTRKCKNCRKALGFYLINLEIVHIFFKLASELYHNQFSMYFF
jgi:hypothetical protein